MEFLALIDQFFAGLLAPAGRALLWGALTGGLGMGIYALIAPQEKIRAIKAQQKENKAKLKAYDGDFEGMSALLKKDVMFSLKLVAVSVVPFVVSMAPIVLLMVGLEAMYADTPFPTLGAAWTGNFEFWFLLAAIVVSLFLKFFFKIA